MTLAMISSTLLLVTVLNIQHKFEGDGKKEFIVAWRNRGFSKVWSSAFKMFSYGTASLVFLPEIQLISGVLFFIIDIALLSWLKFFDSNSSSTLITCVAVSFIVFCMLFKWLNLQLQFGLNLCRLSEDTVTDQGMKEESKANEKFFV